MKLSRFAFRLVPVLALLCGAASASTIIDVTGVDWTRGGGMVIKEDGQDSSAYFAGVISISVTEGNRTFNRDSLCVDLFTNIYLGQQYSTTLLRPEDVAGKSLTRVSWLVDNYLLPTQNSAYGSVLDSSDWVLSVEQGKGIQFAIWDIVHDWDTVHDRGGDGFSAGRVQAAATTDANNYGLGATDAAVLYWAQRYEDLSVNKSNDQAFVYDNVDMGGTVRAQMLIGPQFSDGGPQPVPEPQTLVPAGLALIALGLGLRWRMGKRL